ncbi:VWA domain-containing protein [Streptomyces sp. NPDC056628]|uniref:VWA domain-containing protein n=1 Tax=Streptomyces sp. NPDC056628 TaxID=3345882 RepID=UPI00367E2731
MGILTLLRNAFGRSRKGRTAEAEGATPSREPQPTAPTTVPEPRSAEPTATPKATATATTAEPAATAATAATAEPTTESDDNEHDLVVAAFDNVTVPKQSPPAEQEPAKEEQPKAAEPAAEPEPAPEPVAVTPKAEEPATEPEPEPEAPKAEEPKAEKPKAEPEAPKTEEPEPVAETTPEPEPVAETTPEPEPVAETTPEPEPEPEAPKAEEEPEPIKETRPEEPAATAAAAADGEEAPQGPPAVDDESVTGGAGGSTEAEGEAEAETAVPTNLRTAYEAAAATLTTHHLTGTSAKVYLVLDRSASMRPYYKDGSAQALAEQTLALAAHLDSTDPTVPVVFFSTELDGTGELTLTKHENKIDELHAGLGRMGRTSYHVAVEEVVAHHAKTAPDTPALVVFQTDGAPDAKTPANQALTDAAKKHPNVFFSIVVFGDPEQKAFDYLRKLKTGNTATFFAGESPLELTDEQLYDGILASWRP